MVCHQRIGAPLEMHYHHASRRILALSIRSLPAELIDIFTRDLFDDWFRSCQPTRNFWVVCSVTPRHRRACLFNRIEARWLTPDLKQAKACTLRIRRNPHPVGCCHFWLPGGSNTPHTHRIRSVATCDDSPEGLEVWADRTPD